MPAEDGLGKAGRSRWLYIDGGIESPGGVTNALRCDNDRRPPATESGLGPAPPPAAEKLDIEGAYPRPDIREAILDDRARLLPPPNPSPPEGSIGNATLGGGPFGPRDNIELRRSAPLLEEAAAPAYAPSGMGGSWIECRIGEEAITLA